MFVPPFGWDLGESVFSFSLGALLLLCFIDSFCTAPCHVGLVW